MKNNMNKATLTGAFTGMIALAGSASAALMITEVSTLGEPLQGQDHYDGDVLGNDLIDSNSSTLGSVDATGSPNGAQSGFSRDGINDGSTAGNSNLLFWNTGATQVMVYNLTGSATGYDVDSIVSIYGWNTGTSDFADQNYTVAFSTVGSADFTDLTSVAYDPFEVVSEDGASKVTISDNTGDPLVTGVDAVRFTFTSSSGGSRIGVIREIDVIGSATVVPEPSSTALLGLGGLALIMRRRR